MKYFLLIFFFVAQCNTKKTSNSNSRKDFTQIYFVPNHMSTLNLSLITYNNEFKNYGIKIQFTDNHFEKKLYSLLNKNKEKVSAKNGLRIKIVTSKNDTIFMSYLPEARLIYSKESIKGSPELLNLVARRIKKHYLDEDFECIGVKCLKKVEEKNIDFIN